MDKYKLMKLGITPDLKGFEYIEEAVDIIKIDGNKMNNIVAKIYTEVAEKHKTKPTRVERGIRHAVEKAYKYEALKEVFPYRRPTNKAFLGYLLIRDRDGINKEAK